jgi:hypothetical protein
MGHASIPGHRGHGRRETEKTCISSDDAAKESNLPSRGLPGPASFEGLRLKARLRQLRGLS